ncbi:cytochrome P450 [Streptacidiphilus sp. ASG 303]|uniref:cytochrome P450 n=1 Tax=Streptacidiphilus sp. ASG 303 TaxID=2896847 RepID=UPI0027E188D5|nr:cytochrome P450 [Streptacidiphilus sp. ASG 303]
MTAPSPEHAHGTATPPPGCPAHGADRAHAPGQAYAPAQADGAGQPYTPAQAAVPRQGAPDPDAAERVRFYGPATDADPVGLYADLRRRHGAVAPVLLDGDLPAWLVLGYRENLEVMRAPKRFSRDSRIWRDLREGNVPADSPLLPMVGWRPDCLSADGAEHRRLRGAVTDSLDRFDQRGIRRHVHRVAHRLVDGFCADGRAELLTRYAQHVPMLVLTRLLGLPEEDGPELVRASSDLMTGTERAAAANEHILETLRRLVQRRKAVPGEDLASWMLAHPSRLTDEEVQNHLRLVLVAANATTTSLIANTLRVVLTDPRFRASLAGVRMTVADAVEHVLWNEPPLTACPGGWATADTELAGRSIRAGDMVILGLAAANTDSTVRPEVSAPVRGNRSHLAFSGGAHMCPGQDIGRTITDAAVDVLLLRLPDLRLAVPDEELGWQSSIWARHLEALPVEFAARPPEERTYPSGPLGGADPRTAGGAAAVRPQAAVPASALAGPAVWPQAAALPVLAGRVRQRRLRALLRRLLRW